MSEERLCEIERLLRTGRRGRAANSLIVGMSGFPAFVRNRRRSAVIAINVSSSPFSRR